MQDRSAPPFRVLPRPRGPQTEVGELPRGPNSRRTPRLYIDNGGDTDSRKVPLIELADGFDPVWQLGAWYLDTSLQPGVDGMCAALRTQGVPFKYHREAGGRHNARAWGGRVERPLRTLLPPDS